MTNQPAPRYHALDSLRAVMMLLGIWMHGVQSYTVLPGYNWPLKDTARNEFFDVTLWFIHTHRMHVFYVMAGFFAALLFARRGPLGLAANRAKRILLPFAAGWMVLFPITVITAGWARSRLTPGAAILPAAAELKAHLSPMHLWFLEYLLMLCALYIAAAVLARRFLPAVAKTAIRWAFRAVTASRFALAIFSTAYFGAVLLLGGYVGTPGSFIPDLRILAAYAIFFGFGWMLYLERQLLPRFKRLAWTNTSAGSAAALAMFYLSAHLHAPRIWYTVTSALSCWLLLFGLTGLFLRYLDRPIPVMRYLSDSSYWMYLLHVPLVVGLQGLLVPAPLPALVKGLLVLAAAMPVLLASYHYMVRPTWIGAALNGRRYARRLPEAPALPASALTAES